MTYNEGDKVKITEFNGRTDVTEDVHSRVVGAEAYVKKVYEDAAWLELTIPTHKYYGVVHQTFLARVCEVELLEGAHPLTKESVNS
jgi:hypothetical protein